MRVSKNKYQIIVQKNSFIRGNFSKLEVRDIKILKLLISKVNSTNTEFEMFYSFTKYEAKELLNCNDSNIHNYIKTSLRNLASVFIVIKNDNQEEIEISIIGKIIYEKKYSRYKVPLDSNLKEYLLDIKKEFTKYDLINLISLQQKEQIKLYEYIKSINFNTFLLSLSKLKEIMEITKNSYNSFYNFHKKLKETVKSINESTDIYIDFSFMKSKTEESKNVQFKIKRFAIPETKSDSNLSINILEEKFISKTIILKDEYFTITQIVNEDNFIVLSAMSKKLKLIGKLSFNSLNECYNYLNQSIINISTEHLNEHPIKY